MGFTREIQVSTEGIELQITFTSICIHNKTSKNFVMPRKEEVTEKAKLSYTRLNFNIFLIYTKNFYYLLHLKLDSTLQVVDFFFNIVSMS